MSLLNALQTRAMGENTVSAELNSYMPAIQDRYNSEIAPVLLGRQPMETLPKDARSASSFRSRVSLLVEYSVIRVLADWLRPDGLHATFNVINEFGDFKIRDESWNPLARIDIKTLHDESVEASARFEIPMRDILPNDDYLFFLAWQWREVSHLDVTVAVPWMIKGLVLPAVDVAYERDARHEAGGGTFRSADGRPILAGGNVDTNFGKWNRIVPPSRRSDPTLPESLKRLVALMRVQEEAKASEPEELAAVDFLADQASATPDVTASTDDA